MSRLFIPSQRSLASPGPSSLRPTLAAPRQLLRPRTSTPFKTRYNSSSSSTTGNRQQYTAANESLRSQILKPTTLILICVPILCGFLGVWQIKRLKWKTALIDEVERNLAKEPLVLPGRINLEALPEFAFRRVHLSGTVSSPAILLGPRVYEGVPGWDLIIPLIRDSPSASGLTSSLNPFSSSSSTPSNPSLSSSTILLNRGFIPNTQAELIRSGAAPPPGLGTKIEVDGMLAKESEQHWSPDNDPTRNQWFWKDLEAMKDWVGGEERGVQAVLVEAIEDPDVIPSLAMQRGEPIGKPPIVEIRNQHASYAATWFSLSAATSAMLVFLLRKGKTTNKFTKRR